MATITREQVQKLNSKCENGFKFDTYGCITGNGKQFKKYIPLEEKKYLCATLLFSERWNRQTGETENYPSIHFAECFEKENDILVSYGLGYWFRLTVEPMKRKNTKFLQEQTAVFTDEKCLEVFNSLKSTQVNQMA